MTQSKIRPVLPVIVSGCLLLMLSFGYRAGFGLFMQPMTEANGWGRDVLSMALAVQNLFWGVVAVFAGGIADRYGNTIVLLVGVALYALGMWGMAHSVTELEIVSTAGLLSFDKLGAATIIVFPSTGHTIAPGSKPCITTLAESSAYSL